MTTVEVTDRCPECGFFTTEAVEMWVHYFAIHTQRGREWAAETGWKPTSAVST